MSIQYDNKCRTLLEHEAYTAHCRCSRSLTWDFLNHADIAATAECECGMTYTAWMATIKIEGIDTTTL